MRPSTKQRAKIGKWVGEGLGIASLGLFFAMIWSGEYGYGVIALGLLSNFLAYLAGWIDRRVEDLLSEEEEIERSATLEGPGG